MSDTQDRITKIVDGENTDIEATVEQVGSQGAQIVKNIGGTIVSEKYDYISIAYPDTTTEVYTFKSGGASGTTVATVTLVFTDLTKEFLSTATKT